jgi:hypothetical protein
MKGASEFILSLLIIVIIASLTSLFWLYNYGYLKYVESSGDTSQIGEALSSCMKIDSFGGNNIYIKNCGDGVIKNNTLAVYVDDQQISYSMNTAQLARGAVGSIQIDTSVLSTGGHYFKITTKTSEAERYAVVTLVSGSNVLSLLDTT